MYSTIFSNAHYLQAASQLTCMDSGNALCPFRFCVSDVTLSIHYFQYISVVILKSHIMHHNPT